MRTPAADATPETSAAVTGAAAMSVGESPPRTIATVKYASTADGAAVDVAVAEPVLTSDAAAPRVVVADEVLVALEALTRVAVLRGAAWGERERGRCEEVCVGGATGWGGSVGGAPRAVAAARCDATSTHAVFVAVAERVGVPARWVGGRGGVCPDDKGGGERGARHE